MPTTKFREGADGPQAVGRRFRRRPLHLDRGAAEPAPVALDALELRGEEYSAVVMGRSVLDEAGRDRDAAIHVL